MGALQAYTQAVRVCQQCGQDNPDGFRVCGYCGTPFADAPRQEVRKTVTVIFTDLVGSTNLGESLDSETLREVLSRYFHAMQACIEECGGTVEKFIGDAIVAVFGLPKLREDDALRAINAALEMRSALAQLNDHLESGWGVVLRTRTGINTGEVVAGDITEGQRLVTGDTVNVAARLEQAASAGEILLGDLTYRLVRGSIEAERVEPLELKGKAERVPAHRLLGLREPDAAAEARRGPLVGRAAELARLMDSFEDARRSSSSRLATVLGAAGMGKSTLIAGLADAVADDAMIVRGRCLAHGRGTTFWPIAEIAHKAAGILDDDTPEVARSKIAALVGDEGVAERLAALIGLSNAQFPVEESFWGVRKFFEILCAKCPLVAVIEDVHWAETTLLDLLEHLLATVEAPFLIVCSARPEFFELRPGWEDLPGATALVLAPLSAEDASLVANHLLGDAELDEEVAAQILDAAQGNPLFVEQMVSMLIDEGALMQAEGRWAPAAGLDEIAVPPTIQALLAARLDLLSADERAVIEAASVAGLVFPADAVKDLVGSDIAERLEPLLRSLARKHLVHPEPEAPGLDTRFRFDHALIRDGAYQGMLKRTRATLHERFVIWADRVNSERDRGTEFEEILGYHLEQAYRNLEQLGPLDDRGRGLGVEASARLSAAGKRALNRGDMSAAANLLRRAVALLPEGEGARIELLPDLGEALMETGEFAWAEVFLGEAAEARDAGLISAKAHILLLRVRGQAGRRERWSEQLIPAATRAISRFEEGGDDGSLATAWRLLAWAHGNALRYGRAAEAAERAIEHARLAGDTRQRRRAAAQYAVAALHGPTEVDQAIKRCEEIAAEAADDRRTEGVVRSFLAYLYAMRGDFDEARRIYTSARGTLEELGKSAVAASTSLASYGVEILAGDPVAAERELRRDYAALTELGEKYFLSTVAGELARVLYTQGRFDEADTMSQEAQGLADHDDIASQALWRSARAKVAAQQNRFDEALRLAWEAVELMALTDAQLTKAETLVDLAEVLSLAKRDADAEAAFGEAAALLASKGNFVGADRVRALFSAPAEAASA
jgi:class 3 adenylate cyclase/tetratricopeptide (TPR) repeat protein